VNYDDVPSSSPYVTYLEESRKPFTSFLFCLPLFVAYHVGIWLIHAGGYPAWLNGADLWLARSMGVLGVSGPLVSLFTVTIVFLGLQQHTGKSWKLKSSTLLLMLLECVVFCVPPFLLGRLLQYVMQLAATVSTQAEEMPQLAKIVLGLGAGVYEEFLFRMLLMSFFFFIFRKFARLKGHVLYATAVLLQAVLFALFHYGPDTGEAFSLQTFAFRTIAGVYFAYLYQERGFGIAAGSHAAYNIVAILNSSFR